MYWFFYYFYNKEYTLNFVLTRTSLQSIPNTSQQKSQHSKHITQNNKTHHQTPPNLPHHIRKITTLGLLIIIITLYYILTIPQSKPIHTNNPHHHNHHHNIPRYEETLLPHHKITTTLISPIIHTPPYLPQQPRIQPTIYIDIQHTKVSITFYTIKHPQNKHTTLHKLTTYIMDLQALILLGGDIHPNPGPTTHVTRNLPKDYTQRQKHFFIPNTTTLKPSYTHLEKLFFTYLTQNPPNQELTNIHRHKPLLSQHPLHSQIYALIITYGPTPQICDQHLTEEIDHRCLIILKRLQKHPTTHTTITPHPQPHTTYHHRTNLHTHQ